MTCLFHHANVASSSVVALLGREAVGVSHDDRSSSPSDSKSAKVAVEGIE